MPQPSWAGIITAIGSVITAIALVISSFALLLPILRRTKANTVAIDATTVAVSEVHTIVNQERTDRMRYQAQLVEALNTAGVRVPTDQSLIKEGIQ